MDESSRYLQMMSTRQGILRVLRTRSRSKGEIVDETDLSRSTINRGIRQLEQHTLVEYTRGGYQLTPLGKQVYEQFIVSNARLEALLNARSLINQLRTSSYLHPDFLLGAEFVYADPHAPQRPLSHLESLLTDARSLWSLTPSFHPYFNKGLSQAASRRELHAHILTTGKAMESYFDRIDPNGPPFNDVNQKIRFGICSSLPAFRLHLIEQATALTVAIEFPDESGFTHAVLTNAEFNAHVQSISIFSRYLRDSIPV